MNRKTHKFTSGVCFTLLLLTSIAAPGFAATKTEFWSRSDESNTGVIDHHPWQVILDNYLITDDPSGVNRFRYNDVRAQDRQTLKTYLTELQKIDPRAYRRSEQMAYWINLYNALTVDLVLEEYPVKSIKQIGEGFFNVGPWDDDIALVAGQMLTLNDIEHQILRPIWKDPRIHYAVNCASYGCPNLSASAYTAANVDTQLDRAARDYVNHKRGVDLRNGNLQVSSIYHWYEEDFGGNDEQLLAHLKRYARPELKKHLDGFSGRIDHDYDWSLNDAR